MQASPGSDPPSEPLRFRQCPLAIAALWLALGIALSRVCWQPAIVLLVALALLVSLATLALALCSRVAWLPVAAIWFTLGLAAAEWQPGPSLPLELLAKSDNLSRMVVATVLRVHPAPAPLNEADADPIPSWERTETGESDAAPLFSLDLAVEQVEDVTPEVSRMQPVAGGIRVSVYPARLPGVVVPELRCGDQLQLPLRLKMPERYRNPGQFQYADYLLGQGIAARSSIAADRILVSGHEPAAFSCRLAAAQTWAAARLSAFAASSENRRLPSPLRLTPADASMLDSMLFGDRTGLTHALRTAFERTGSFHLFVVSGLHLALFAGGFFWLLRKARFPDWLATAVTLIATTFYAALTGFGEPSRRALGMLAVFLVARLLSRDRNPLNALGAAVVAMLVWAPSSLFEAGFQMTILAIVAIAGIAVPLAGYTWLHAGRVANDVFRQPHRNLSARDAELRMRLELWGEILERLLGRRALRFGDRNQSPLLVLTPRRLPAFLVRAVMSAGELALIGLVTELVMVLPMALWFHRAAVFALPANMIVLPLLALLIPAAVTTFAGSLAGPWCAVVPGALTAALLHSVALVVGRLSALAAADVRVPGPAAWVGVLIFLGVLGCCWLVRSGWRGALATVVLLPLLAAAALWPEPMQRAPPADRALEITAIDVGQGDSLLAVSPTGETMLIEAGGPTGRHGMAEIVSSFDVGEEVVAPYLWSRQIRRLDILVLTHAHTDHMGGMPAILRDLRPRELWVGIDPDSALFRALLAEAVQLGITVRHLHAGDRRQFGPVDISILAPQPDYANRAAPKNDDSLVLQMRNGQASVLLEGDAERPSEDAMLAAGSIHPVTLLKVAHHGSKTSSNPEFLQAAAPEEAIISVGLHNSFGHPRGEVIERFAEAHTRLFRTDLFGLTSFYLTPDGRIREQVGASTAAR